VTPVADQTSACTITSTSGLPVSLQEGNPTAPFIFKPILEYKHPDKGKYLIITKG
jgi:hypothetical protein